jgi:flavin-dependent dehydrogenase
LDRTRFDRMLADAARDAGAKVMLGTRVRNCVRESPGTWRVAADGATGPLELRAGFLINTLGRSASPAGLGTGRRGRIDSLVAVIRFFGSPSADALRDRRTLVEAVEGGWWYTALLPERRVVAAFLSDADLLPDVRADRNDAFRRRVSETSLTQEWLRGCKPDGPVRVVSSNSYLATPVAGEGWVSAGDAALAFDPLSDDGISKAMRTGVFAAQTALRAVAGDRTAVIHYAEGVEAEFRAYLLTRAEYYANENRWPSSRFWQRRRSTGAPAPETRPASQER